MPNVRSLIKGLDAQSALPMLLSAYVKFDTPDFNKIVKWLLVFIARAVFTDLDSSGIETLLFGLARSIRAIPEGDAKAKIAKLGEIKDTLKKSAPTKEQIEASVERIILPNDSAEYIIRKLSDAMESKTKESTTGRESNLEHIFPLSPTDTEWGGPENQATLEPYTWHLGNLMMLGERLNNKSKNMEYELKRPIYAKSELAMARKVAEDYEAWTKSTIEDRANKLAPLLTVVWDFDNPSRV